MSQSRLLCLSTLIFVVHYSLASGTEYGEAIWTNSDGGNYSDPANWLDGTRPESFEVLHFGQAGGEYQVSFDEDAFARGLLVFSGYPRFDLQGNALDLDAYHNVIGIGASNGGDARLTVENGSLASGMTIVGRESGERGSVTIVGPGTSWENRKFLYVGYGGTGSLTVSESGNLASSRMAVGATGVGSVLVSGPGSRISLGGWLSVGEQGDGTLTIEQSANLTTSIFNVIGGDEGGVGHVAVTGNGSTWTTSAGIEVGNEGSGSLLVSDGATVTSEGSSYVGKAGVGEVTVEGVGSAWTNHGRITVGHQADGRIVVADRGTISTALLDVQTLGEVSGDGVLRADVSNSGSVAPGLPIGHLSVDGDYYQEEHGVLDIQIGGTGSDLMTVTGRARLAGELNVQWGPDASPRIGDSYNILTASAIESRFGSENFPALPHGLDWRLDYEGTNVSLRVVPEPSASMPASAGSIGLVVFRRLRRMSSGRKKCHS